MVESTAATWLIVVVLGTAVGSFLNVVILRTYQDRQWWRGRSACPKCGTVLHWYELIPVLSYVALGGQCRHCRTALSRQYFIVELLTALTFVAIFAATGISSVTLFAWITASAMIALTVYDSRWSLLPDSFSIFFAATAIIVSILMHRPWLDIALGGLSGVTFFGLQFIFSKGTWVGSGDILLGLGLGLLLGWQLLALCLLLAYFSGAIVASALILSRRLQRSSTMPFGPYLLAAGFVSWQWGEQIIDWYFRHALFR